MRIINYEDITNLFRTGTEWIETTSTNELKDMVNILTTKIQEMNLKILESEYKKETGIEINTAWFHKIKMAKGFCAKNMTIIGIELRKRKAQETTERRKTDLELFISISESMLTTDVFEKIFNEWKICIDLDKNNNNEI